MRKYRIGIDCRLAGARHAGIGRYVVELVKRVTAHNSITWVLFFSDSDQVQEIFPQGIPPHSEIILSPVAHYSLAEQLIMPRKFAAASLDLLHVPHFNVPSLYQGKLIITIHDLLWHQHRGMEVTTLPAWQYWLKYMLYRLVTYFAVTKAHTIFVPTQAVRDTLIHYYPSTAQKIVITPEGVGVELLSQVKSHQSDQRDNKQLLYVGSLYPHKNVALVIQSLQQLKAYKLVIIGSRTVFRDKLERLVRQLKLQSRVEFVGKVSDQALARYYAQSFALVQPSLSEGFGLTGLEAMAFSTPVIASDIAVFREVYQNAAVYFDPHSLTSFCQAVETVAKQSSAETKRVTRSVSKLYSWDLLADQTLEQYEAALHHS